MTMAEFEDTITINASADVVFDVVADVSHLPQYFARMTSAVPGDGDEVITTASLADGSEVEGTAWFRVDSDALSVSWGAEGEHDYHGSVDVRLGQGSCEVVVHLHTSRVEAGDPEVQQGVHETVANIKNLVENP